MDAPGGGDRDELVAVAETPGCCCCSFARSGRLASFSAFSLTRSARSQLKAGETSKLQSNSSTKCQINIYSPILRLSAGNGILSASLKIWTTVPRRKSTNHETSTAMSLLCNGRMPRRVLSIMLHNLQINVAEGCVNEQRAHTSFHHVYVFMQQSNFLRNWPCT